MFCAEFRVTLQKCNDLGNQPQNKLKHGLKYFKNPFNKEGFKRVVILTLIERMGVRKISLKSV